MKHPGTAIPAASILVAESTGHMPLIDGARGTIIRVSRDPRDCYAALLLYRDRELRTRVVEYVPIETETKEEESC